MTLSEAIEQYLDARDVVHRLKDFRNAWADEERSNAIVAIKEAAERMDQLAPAREA